MSSITSFWRSRGMSRMPNASVAVVRSPLITACEKYGGTASSSALTLSRLAGVPDRKRSGSDSAGHSSGGSASWAHVAPTS
jgi:hypothetical protein